MARYRNNSSEVDADQYIIGDIIKERWIVEAMHSKSIYAIEGDGLFIKTPEGDKRASPTDWIVKGPKGDIYLCSADEFSENYEAL